MGLLTCRARPSSGAAPPASSSGGSPSRRTGGILANAVYSTQQNYSGPYVLDWTRCRLTYGRMLCEWNELSSHTPATHISFVFVMRVLRAASQPQRVCPAGWSTRDPKRPRPPQGVCPSGWATTIDPPSPPSPGQLSGLLLFEVEVARAVRARGGEGKAATSDGTPRGRRGRWWCGAPAPCLVLSLSGWFGRELPARRQALPREALTLACGCWL